MKGEKSFVAFKELRAHYFAIGELGFLKTASFEFDEAEIALGEGAEAKFGVSKKALRKIAALKCAVRKRVLF